MFVPRQYMTDNIGSLEGGGHNINASTYKRSLNERDNSESKNTELEGESPTRKTPMNRNYERLMLDSDKMKPHSMFVKGMKFGGLKKT